MKPATTTATIAKTGIVTGGAVLLGDHIPLSGAIVIFVAAVFLGIALPAAWSTKPARRAAALAVLKEILAALHHSHSS